MDCRFFFAFLTQLFLVLEHYNLKRRRLLLREASLFACWMGIRNPKNKLIRSPFHLLKAARKENTFGPIRYNPPRKLLIYTELEEAIYKATYITLYIKRDGFSLQICKWMKNSQNVCSIEFCRSISSHILKWSDINPSIIILYLHTK